MALRPVHIPSALLLACAALVPAHAAELGEARVLSYIGQPLAAEVELTLVEDGTRPVQAHLARADVYRGANIAMPPALSGLDITVIRQGGKQFLRLASVKPVDSRHLHIYLELIDGGQRSVRLVTLWLTPDPHPPALAPASAPILAPIPAPAPAVLVAAKTAPVVNESAPVAAEPASSKLAPAPLRKPMLLKRRPAGSDAKDEAATDDAHGIHAVPVHSAASAKPAAHPGKAPGKAPGEEAAARPIAQPAEHSAAGAVKPAACSPAPTGAELNACAVLGAKNEALRHELGQLEDKVKVLQVANGLTPAEESEAESLQEAQAKPKAAPRIHRKPKVEAPPEAPLPWLAIGGALAGVLALAGLALALLRRRRAKASQVLEQAREPEVVVLPQGGDEVADAGRPSLMSIIKARWTAMRSRKQGSQDAVEPSISQPE